jgi:hypothetical protein
MIWSILDIWEDKMHKMFISFILVCTLAIPAYSQETTEENEETTEVGVTTTDLRLRPNQGWIIAGQLILAPAYFLAYITVHEGSHAIATLILGWEVDRFEPYPHEVEYRDSNGDMVSDFFFGYTWFTQRTDEPWVPTHIRIAPFLTDILLFVNCDLLLQYVVDPHSDGAPFLLVGGMIAPLVDFVGGLNCMNNHCDLSEFSTATGVPRGVLMIIGYSLALTAFWRCLHQFRRIFLEPRLVQERRREREHQQSRVAISISPLLSDEMSGLGIFGAF